MSVLRLESRGRIRILRLDKGRGNAIDETLAEDLIRVTGELAADESVHAVYDYLIGESAGGGG